MCYWSNLYVSIGSNAIKGIKMFIDIQNTYHKFIVKNVLIEKGIQGIIGWSYQLDIFIWDEFIIITIAYKIWFELVWA
jgi:hypothetical protein